MENNLDIKDKTIKGVAWNTIGRFSYLGIQFVVGVVLARILSPNDYGVVGVLTIFFAVANAFVDSGFSSALIQRQNLTDVDCSTVFHFNIMLGVVAYVILYISAPYIAAFFDLPILISVTRVSGINVLIGAVTSVQQTLFRKKVDFKTISIITIISAIVSGVISLYMAYAGMGVWALVAQQLILNIITAILTWIVSKWKPRLCFSVKSFKEMFSYGIKLLGTSLLGIIYFHGEKLAIGKFYSPQQLGYYNQGTLLASQGSSTITNIISTVTFPVLSTIQDDDEQLMSIYQKYIKISSLVIFFIMMLLVALAKPIIVLLYTKKWIGAVIFLQIICFSLMFGHITTINLNLFCVKGRSDILLKLEIVKRIISISILLISIPFGVVAICISRVVYEQIAMAINTYYTGKLFNYGLFKQWKDFGEYFVLSFLSVIPAYLLTLSEFPVLLDIVLGTCLSLFIYVLILKAKKDVIFSMILNEIKSRLKLFYVK